MWMCAFCTIVAAVSTFTAGAPLTALGIRHQDSNFAQNYTQNGCKPSTHLNHLQRRLFWGASDTTPARIPSTIISTKHPDLTAGRGLQPAELLAETRHPSKLAQSKLPASRSAANPSSPEPKEAPSTQKPGPNIVPQKPYPRPHEKTKTQLSASSSQKTLPSKTANSEAFQELERPTPFSSESNIPSAVFSPEEGKGSISSPRRHGELPLKPPNWVEKVREFWDKILQKIKRLFRPSKKNEPQETDGESPKTTATEPDRVHSHIADTTKTHHTSENAHPDSHPAAQKTDSEIMPTPHTHASTYLRLPNFDFLQLTWAIPGILQSWLGRCLLTSWLVCHKERPSPPAPSRSISLPAPSRQNADEISEFNWLPTATEQTSKSAQEPASMHGFSPQTPGGRLIAAALERFNSRDLAESIRNGAHSSNCLLRVVAYSFSVKQIQDILLEYGHKTIPKVGKIIEQHFSQKVIEFVTDLITTPSQSQTQHGDESVARGL
ncbi:hypothetical protein PTTG_07775 [Puccinia triticina 1-1 BBBD Race 1]|uniref:Uncharacterized protein n=1 Tax=Puccinia triticina (isolate 1-1 / race 1 (BBBD)) TaxID=630390 RepID=A0A180G9C7_PUCT1|nr:hypothetical protein PTTG_07775 [Puccinia triticina 1-1 BBBD Race 1]